MWVVDYDKDGNQYFREFPRERVMEFDKSRVYTALNADELRAGDKVILGDSVAMLKSIVQDANCYEKAITELTEIRPETCEKRFHNGNWVALLAYLVERAENCTNCGEGKWDAEHQKILCDPVHYGNGNVIFRNHEIEVCNCWKPKKKCDNCRLAYERDGEIYCKMHDRIITDPDIPCYHHEPKNDPNYEYDVPIKGQINEDGVIVERQVGECHVKVKPFTEEVEKAEKHTDYNHCEEAKKAYACAMTNACPYKHYRPFKDTDELIKVWCDKGSKWQKREITMPFIWVRYKDKHIPQKGTLIRTFFDEAVSVDEKYLSLETLFNEYEFLDGSPCGVEE